MSDITVVLEFIILILCVSIVVLSKSGDRVESGSLAVYKIHQDAVYTHTTAIT